MAGLPQPDLRPSERGATVMLRAAAMTATPIALVLLVSTVRTRAEDPDLPMLPTGMGLELGTAMSIQPLATEGMTAHGESDPRRPISTDTSQDKNTHRPWWRMNEKLKEEKERVKNGRRREPERPRGPQQIQEEREKEKVKIQAAYDAYKEELQAKMARTFVGEHKKEQWFRERYVPEVRDSFRQQLNEFRRGLYSSWEQELDSGMFDDFSLEGLPKAKAMELILGVGDLVPANGADIRDDSLLLPTLLIKTIAPHVSRQNLESFCKEHLGEGDGGFRWLSLSDPNPSKRYHRIGWVMLHPVPAPVSTAEKALDAVNGKTVKDEVRGDFVCHVGVHNPPKEPRKKALWDLFSAPERIEKDLDLATKLVSKLEEDFGSDFKAVLKIEERVDELKHLGRLQAAAPVAKAKKTKKQRQLGMDEALDDEGEEEEGAMDEDEEEEGAVDEDDDVDDEDLIIKKKQLDLLIEYLRRHIVYLVKAVARATVNGEPFPGKKRSEAPEEGEAEVHEGDKSSARRRRKRNNNSCGPRGRPIEQALDDELAKFVKQEDEHKWRCKIPDCTKLFKEEHFWRKHVEKRHAEWLDGLTGEFELINAYVLDPSHIAPSRTDANSNGHFPQANGQGNSGTPRGFNLQNFAMGGMMSMPGFPMPTGPFPPLFVGHPMPAGNWNAAGDDRGGQGGQGPIRRGGMHGGRGGAYRSGPYDRRGGGRWDGSHSGGRNRGGGGRWGDGAAGAAVGPREAVQGRSLKSYEDLDHAAGGGGGELNY
ncbi:unnamed protein product [Parascedosporium putredinis]|uniref:C2H2-type domain-containing protein n=1 Tax=Parascedosporium putredinis TaxID=1442378 RepID=A0A9P1H5W4_9PEZI|nr:unnamed protein product [Parascedosporium putredinis]CAI7998129.1 unnamed protein product [Parascedosporium putredinis]